MYCQATWFMLFNTTSKTQHVENSGGGCNLQRVLVHNGVAEVGKGLLVQYLCEQVRQVLLGIHIHRCDDLLVTQSLDPYCCLQSMCLS